MVIRAVKQVAGPSFFALLVIAVAFLPILTLEAQEGRLFKPLAYTKNLAMIIAAVLAITLDPALRLLLTRMDDFSFRPRWLSRVANTLFVGRIHSEEKHPVSRFLMRIYDPVLSWSLRWKWAVIAGALGLMIATVPVYLKLGSEFMPPLEEGLHPLHAHHHAGHLHCRGPEGPPGHGPDHQAVPRGGVRAGQGGTGPRPRPTRLRFPCWRP